MKPTRKQLTNGIFLLLAALYLFTPMGFYVKVQMNRWFSFSPSVLEEKEQRNLTSYNWQLLDAQGNSFRFENGKNKVVVVSFWATWCPPCVAEMPSFQKLYDNYGDRAMFIFLANDEVEKVNAFVKKKHYSFPVYFARTNAPKELEHPSIPTTYVIDKKGSIVLKKIGAADWDSPKVFTLLDGLLKE